MDHPTFVKIQYWSPIGKDWWTGHSGINLMDPKAYIQGVTDKGRIARAVVVETGEIIYPDGGDLL